eukprot:1657605-Pleurochrysis_carterae.AAC.2
MQCATAQSEVNTPGLPETERKQPVATRGAEMSRRRIRQRRSASARGARAPAERRRERALWRPPRLDVVGCHLRLHQRCLGHICHARLMKRDVTNSP